MAQSSSVFRATLAASLIAAIGSLSPVSARAAESLTPKHWKMPNGMTVLLIERHAVPAVSVRASIPAGAVSDPPGKAGLASLTASLMDEGTKTRSSQDIARAIDFVGGSLGVDGGPDYASASLRVLKKDFSLGMDLLSDILRNPSFPQAEVDRVKNNLLARLIQEKDEPTVVAGKAFDAMILGDAPYGRPVEGTEETIPKITCDDIVGFHGRYYRPNGVIVAFVGDLTEAEAREATEKAFGSWSGQGAAAAELARAKPLEKITTKLIQKELTQATVVFGHLGIARSNPDFYPLLVMNYILGGGGFASRMVTDIRDNSGLVYDISSGFSPGLYPGSFEVSFQTKNASADIALEKALGEIRKIQSAPVNDKELADAKAYLIGSFPLKLDTSEKLAGLLPYIEFYGLGLDYLDRYPSLINAVTKQDVLRVAKTYLHPDRYGLVVVGNLAEAKIKER